ncbi:MAG: hypothetical protein MJZ75_06090 [Paludibacteraceae bacterium]|nr:hypothetical protein [Paludibacteraceae bacterium]
MKKILLLSALFVAGVVTAVAQPRAIGANLGSGLGFSYQHGFGDKNMLDVAANVPLLTWGIGGHVTYDWIDPFGTAVPWSHEGEWHWAMGVGAAGGIYGFNDINWHVGVAGHVGVAYDFWFPMELSIDWRPEIGIIGAQDALAYNVNGLWLGGVSLGIRYLF